MINHTMLPSHIDEYTMEYLKPLRKVKIVWQVYSDKHMCFRNTQQPLLNQLTMHSNSSTYITSLFAIVKLFIFLFCKIFTSLSLTGSFKNVTTICVHSRINILYYPPSFTMFFYSIKHISINSANQELFKISKNT